MARSKSSFGYSLAAILLAAAAATLFAAGKPAEQKKAKGAPTAVPTAAPAEAAKPPVDEKAEKERLALQAVKVNATSMSLGDIESALDRQSPLLRKELADKEKRKEFIDKLVTQELLAEEAARRGFDKNPEVTSVLKNQLASLMQRKISDSIKDSEPSEAELRKYYDEHADDYHKAEKVRARQIVLRDEAKAKAQLKDIIAKKINQHDFRRLAQEISEDEETKARGGDLTYFTRPADLREGDPVVDPSIVDAAFKLKNTGDVCAQLVKTSKGFHIVMLTGRREKMEVPFDEAKSRLSVLVGRELRKTNIENAVNDLKNKFKVDISQENLKYVVIDLSGVPPEPDASRPGVPIPGGAPGAVPPPARETPAPPKPAEE